MQRRPLLAWPLAGLAALAAPARAALVNAPPIKFGIEDALVLSGFADHLRRAIGGDIGLPMEMHPGPGLDLLDQARAGTIEVALTQVTAREEAMEKSGMIHSRKLIATSSYVLVGPASDPAGVKGAADVLQALDRIASAGQADPARVAYIGHGDLNGGHETEGALWKALGPRPVGTWLRQAPRGGARAAHDLAAQTPGAYALVERGIWSRTRSPLRVVLEGDPRLAAPYHVYLPFATRHPAGKLVGGWLTTASGKSALRKFGKDYRVAGS